MKEDFSYEVSVSFLKTFKKEEFKTYYKSDDFYKYLWKEFINLIIYEQDYDIFNDNILYINYFYIEDEIVSLHIEMNILPVFYNKMIEEREFEEWEVKKMNKKEKINYLIQFLNDFIDDGEPDEYIMGITGFQKMINTIKYSSLKKNKVIDELMKELSIPFSES
jgi:hypothetical protein